MNQIVQILLSALGVIITGLASWLVAKVTGWINTKTKDKKIADISNTILTVVTNSVCEIYQCFVQELKDKGTFDKDAQKAALDSCLVKIKTQLTPEIMDYISDNFGDITSYLTTLIESTIYSLKN